VPGVVTLLKEVTEVSKEDLDQADGIVLGCPTYFANIPGEMKTIIDDSQTDRFIVLPLAKAVIYEQRGQVDSRFCGNDKWWYITVT